MNVNIETIEQFAVTLQQQVLGRIEADEEGVFKEEVFVQVMLDYLAEADVIEDAEVCLHRAKGIQISGYSLSENGESLDILVAIHTDEVPPQTVAKADADAAIKRAIQFFNRASEGYHHEIEESGSVFDAAQQIFEARRCDLTQVRFLLITDGIIKNPPPKDRDLPRIRANFEIWDIERLYRQITSGKEREAIEIDFTETIGAPIPCLAQPDTTPGYAAYLAIFPAKAIVELYGKYGSRLLERNVRSFLQARGKVNKGMRDTIRKEPQMFLAFNNGLSATAEAVIVEDMPGGGKGLRTIRDLQIVNGGQTTASIFQAAKRDKADVSQLFVQVKLTVLNNPSQMDSVVPLISRYANSQNTVQEADLAANDAYHRKIEEFSRTVWAPAKEGVQRQTRWFYERARGQYLNEKLRAGTDAKIREFEAMSPKAQLFTKTDLAKVLMLWQQRPDIVCKGSQKCFIWFMNHLDKIQEADGTMDERNFERLGGRLILCRAAERIVKKKDMPFTGYWAYIVAYTVARLVHETKGLLDLGRIWKEQKISLVLEGAIDEISRSVWSHIIDPRGVASVTEYCKQVKCWTGFLEREVYISAAVRAETLPSANKTGLRGQANAQTIIVQENVSRVMATGSSEWFAIHTWAKKERILDNLQLSLILDLAAAASSGATPSTRNANEGVKILDKVKSRGYTSLVPQTVSEYTTPERKADDVGKISEEKAAYTPLFPALKKSERVREYNIHQPVQRAEVVHGYLFKSLQHRQLDVLLGYDPDESKGWQSMGILHYLGLVDKHKGYFHNTPLKKAIALLEAEDAAKFSDITGYLHLYSEHFGQ